MKAEYTEVQRQADRLQFKMKDLWDKPDASEARDLQSRAIDLREAIEMGKNPDQLEILADDLGKDLDSLARSSDGVMSIGDAQVLRDEYRRLAETFKHM